MFNVLSPFYCGIILIIIGVMYLIRALLGVTIPVFRIVCSSIFIYAGVCILVGPIPANDAERKTFILEKIKTNATKTHRTYTSILSQTTIDLTTFAVPTKKKTIEINNVFGAVDITLNPDIPTHIIFERAFANIHASEQDNVEHTSTLPAPIATLFGAINYRNYTGDTQPLLEIRSRNAFGTISIYNDALIISAASTNAPPAATDPISNDDFTTNIIAKISSPNIPSDNAQ